MMDLMSCLRAVRPAGRNPSFFLRPRLYRLRFSRFSSPFSPDSVWFGLVSPVIGRWSSLGNVTRSHVENVDDR
ncbi:hypothetical protein TNCV_1277491 [Trichonephila clavipes]|nr:hypothetical protein TNCV_1277491 [Trichonephila clavipes]